MRVIVALLTLSACKREPVRLSLGQSDSVVVNSSSPVRLPVRALDGAGRELSSKGVRYQWVSGDFVRVSADGRVTCVGRGDAQLLASLGAASKQFLLFCRPVSSVRVSLDGQLVVGGPPQKLVLNAYGTDSQPVTLLAGHATVLDSTIASLSGLRVFPKMPGETTVDVELGHCVASMDVTVDERVDSVEKLDPYQQFVLSPLRVVPGEIRSWRLTPGVYDITLRSGTSSEAELLMGANKMNCITNQNEVMMMSRVAHREDAQAWTHCIAMPGASLVVRHPRAIGLGHPITGELVVRRIPDPWSGAGRIGRKRWAVPRERECDQIMMAKM